MWKNRNAIDLRNEDESVGGGTPTPDTSQGKKDGNTERTYSEAEYQAELMRVMKKVRSEAQVKAEKSILERFKADSVDALAAQLQAKQDADNAEKTAIQQMQERLEALEKERNEAKEQADKLAAQRKADAQRDAFKKAATGARDTDDLFAVVQTQFGTEYAAAFNEDGSVNESKMAELLNTLRKQKTHLFGVTTPGIPSNRNNGNAPELSKEQREAARLEMLRRSRKNV